MNGQMCYITADNSKIHKIEPLSIGTSSHGEAFDIDAWAEKKQLQRDEGAKDRLVATAIKNQKEIKKLVDAIESSVERLQRLTAEDSLSIKKFI